MVGCKKNASGFRLRYPIWRHFRVISVYRLNGLSKNITGGLTKLDAKALMVIGSLCPISVEGVIKRVEMGQHWVGVTYGCTDGMNVHM
jgi:hypothetical protein